MDYATTATETYDIHIFDPLDPVETLPAVNVAPLAVGLGPLVGTGSTLGAYPNRVRVLRPQTRGLGANVTGALPCLGKFLGPSGKNGGMTPRPTPITSCAQPQKNDRWLCERLLAPHSLRDTIPQRERH